MSLKTLISYACLLVILTPAAAQDTHYWTNQFGTRSSLLSGALVAGDGSNAMVYYNPGALGHVDSSSFSINASLYQLENVSVKSIDGDGANFNNTQFVTIPLVISGILRTRMNTKVKFGYGVHTPSDFKFIGDTRLDKVEDIIDDEESPGPEEFLGTYRINSRLSETLFMFGAGYPVTEKLSVGVTLGVIVRNQLFASDQLYRTILNSEPPKNEIFAVTFNRSDIMSYLQVRTGLKFGLSYQEEKHAFGLTLTTPSLSIYSTADVSADYTGSRLKYPNGTRGDVVASAGEVKLSANYKNPWSIGAGYTYHLENGSISVAAQYFGRIKPFRMIEASPGPFFRPAYVFPGISADSILSVYHAAKPVFNLAIGFDRQLTKSFGLMTGFRTNFSYFDPALLRSIGVTPRSTSWDIYYATFGGRFSNTRNDLMFGIQVGYGGQAVTGLLDIRDDDGDGNFLEPGGEAKGRYWNIGLIIGWNYIFRSKPSKEPDDNK